MLEQMRDVLFSSYSHFYKPYHGNGKVLEKSQYSISGGGGGVYSGKIPIFDGGFGVEDLNIQSTGWGGVLYSFGESGIIKVK